MLGCGCGVASHSHRILLLVVVKHVCQDILGVLETLSHLSVIAIQSLVKRHGGPFSLFVNICNIPVL